MRPLSARDMLEIWERTSADTASKQALAPLAFALPERSWEDLSLLPVGQRDALLLELYHETFGPSLELTARCPHCQEQLEVDLSVDDLRAGAEPNGPQEAGGELQLHDLTLRFRAPTSLDLATIPPSSTPQEARLDLLERCLVAAHRSREEISFEQLSDTELEALEAAVAETDPLGEILVEVECPECELGWRALLDVGGCFWHRLAAVSRRVPYEVHSLASAYGWAERDLLAMAPERRRLYLEMIGA